jgi:DNA-directed RNA polymerase specialized sigma24 family protein
MKLVQQLPKGYKTVFNLFVVDGYGHAEIAKMLNISENTSKTQLFKARQILQEIILKQDLL